MGLIARAEREAVFRGRRRDQRVGDAKPGRMAELLDIDGGAEADIFRDGEVGNPKTFNEILYQARLLFIPGTLQEFHEANDGHRPIGVRIDNPTGFFAFPGDPNENVGIKEHGGASGFRRPISGRLSCPPGRATSQKRDGPLRKEFSSAPVRSG